MKKIILLTGIIGSCFFCTAQYVKPDEVPQNIRSVVDSLCMHRTMAIWKEITDEQWNPQSYYATFINEHARYWAAIDKSGKLIEVEKEYGLDTLPEKIKLFIEDNYKNNRIYESRIVYSSGQYFYYLRIRAATMKTVSYDLLLTTDGNLVSKKSNVLTELLLVATATFGQPAAFSELFYVQEALLTTVLFIPPFARTKINDSK